MHKFFAKTLFLGKKVIFLPECHSTNEELVLRARKFNDAEGTVIYTDYQDSGRGQRGNKWVAEPGKNILVSMLLRPKFLASQDLFYLNLIAGLALLDTVEKYVGDNAVMLKWPNDVYINQKKIAGILIESNFRGGSLESVVLGIGLNVNQTNFDLEKATSLRVASHKENDFERLAILEEIILRLEFWYLRLKNGHLDEIKKAYHHVLMWRGEVHCFKSALGEFKGEIVGLDSFGKLAVKVGEQLKTFDVKEVEFIE